MLGELVSELRQHKSACSMHPLPSYATPPLPPSHPPGHHSARLASQCYTIASHQLSHLTHPIVYMLMLPSPLRLSAPGFLAVSASPFLPFASPFLPCKYVHRYRFSRFIICINVNICFSFLTYFTMYNETSSSTPWNRL